MSQRGQTLLEILRESLVIGDGAMGSLLLSKGIALGSCFEQLNLTQPDLIRSIHTDYISAGAQFIETNSFGANRIRLFTFGLEDKTRDINLAAARIAREAANENVFVAGSVGPIGRKSDPLELTEEDELEAFKEQISALAEGGVDVIILETFLELDELKLALKAAKEVCDLPVVCQLAALDEGHTQAAGRAALATVELVQAGADVIGANCGAGPSRLLSTIDQMAKLTELPISAFPNLGYQQYLDGRFLYVGTPEYFAEASERILQAGASLIGGCCGTTPEHISLLAKRLADKPIARRARPTKVELKYEPKPIKPPMQFPNFLDKVGKEPVVIVELDPPRGLDCEKVLEGAETLAKAGVDAISIGDNSLASIRPSNIVFAQMMMLRAKVPTICHISCRDHNLIGMQSVLMGAALVGVPALLAVTGDPARLAPHVGASSVFDINAFELVELISKMNRGVNSIDAPIGRATNFLIGVGFNPNVFNLAAEVRRLKKKIEKGAQFCLTQCVFDVERIRKCGEVMKEVGIPIFVGISILVSARNAEWWFNEMPGVTMPEEILKRMQQAPKEKAVAEGIAIARELVDVALEVCPGVFLVPPFSRAEYALPLVVHVKAKVKAIN